MLLWRHSIGLPDDITCSLNLTDAIDTNLLGMTSIDGLTLSDPEYLDTLQTWGGQIVPAGRIWPLEASEATVEATKQTNIVPDIFLYL